MCINTWILGDEPSHKMPSSPIGHFSNPEPLNDFNDISSPEMCDCQNQLGHWDWNGVPHQKLPDSCKRSMGINIDNAPTSDRKGELISDGLRGRNWHTWKVDSDGDTSVTESESDGDTSVTESESNGNTSVIESDPDQEWSSGKINILKSYKGLKKWVVIEQAVQKDSIGNASGDLKDITNKVDATNPTCTKGRKRRLSEDENLGIMTCKKSKVSVHVRIFTCKINAFKRRTFA